MSVEKANQPAIPKWAWIFAIACFVIPVTTMGGAIPGAIGGFSGFTVITIARQVAKPIRKRLVMCGVVTGSAWTVFVVFLLAVTALQAKHPVLAKHGPKPIKSRSRNVVASQSDQPEASSRQETELTEEKRRKIYEMAMRTRSHIDFARENASSAKHIARLEEMHESRLDFTTRFHDITRTELDDIIAEGMMNNWPTD